ncbi:MAG: Hsp20/alpha crystallin family protein [Firmicutes bacterium]|nr:Hsp20/alpha crystallin family protein [Bacillota bacterium]
MSRGLIPFGRQRNLERNIERTLDRTVSSFRNLLESFFEDDVFEQAFFATDRHMRTDIKETEKEYIIEAELPGFNKDEIQIAVQDDYLTLTAQRLEEKQEENSRYISRERRFGTIRRSFRLDNVDTNNITAKYENGLLCIRLPKLEPRSTSRIIDIQ